MVGLSDGPQVAEEVEDEKAGSVRLSSGGLPGCVND